MERRSRRRGPGKYPLLAVVLGIALSCLVPVAGASATGYENRDLSCPAATIAFPGYRPYLPDCRAYELVPPVFEQGFEPQIQAISEDGTHLIMRSLGAFAGLEGGDIELGAYYELSRSPSGWEVSPISPPASLFPTQLLDAASPDLSKTLFSARTSQESVVADNFYLRETNGTITKIVKIGPLFSPATTTGPAAGENDSFAKGQTYYVDASADLSHVLYRMARPLFEGDAWLGDTTVGLESLLEYSGTGNSEPELVGIKPGPEEAKDKPSENPILISTCGTSLGSVRSHDLYNAVSADGTTVFFTAIAPPFECGSGVLGEGPEVNELYARVNGRETVPISEPAEEQCEDCNTGVKAPAEFEGASQDGSKVFFLTSQELLAGATGPSLYEYDFDNPPASPGAPDGKIVPVSTGSAAPEVQGVARVSEDGSHVYFVARGMLTTEPDRSLPAGHQVALAGENNLYVFERDAAYPAGRVTFIATLSSESEAELKEKQEACSGSEKEVCEEQRLQEFEAKNQADATDWQQSDIRPVQATPDGRFLVFQSVADLTAGDTGEQSQIFEYDALTGELVRVSRGASDNEPQGTESANLNASEIEPQRYSSTSSPAEAGTKLAVSADGATVVFGSAGALTPGAQTGAQGRISTRGAYEYRSSVASGGSIGEGDVYLIRPPSPGVPQLDASAQDIFFVSAESLVPQDSDTQFDIYDARVGGGFPGLVSPVECGGVGCAPPVVQSALGAPGSAGVVGGGNLPPPPPPPVVVVKPGSGSLTRAQKLARALKVCRKDVRHVKRQKCEKAARAKYGPRRKKAVRKK